MRLVAFYLLFSSNIVLAQIFFPSNIPLPPITADANAVHTQTQIPPCTLYANCTYGGTWDVGAKIDTPVIDINYEIGPASTHTDIDIDYEIGGVLESAACEFEDGDIESIELSGTFLEKISGDIGYELSDGVFFDIQYKADTGMLSCIHQAGSTTLSFEHQPFITSCMIDADGNLKVTAQSTFALNAAGDLSCKLGTTYGDGEVIFSASVVKGNCELAGSVSTDGSYECRLQIQAASY